MAHRPAPVADWVTIPDLYRDPFPIYERLRAEGGVHWAPQVGRYLVTSYEAVHETELDQTVYSANERDSLQILAMGHSMLRRDDPEHYVERRAWQPTLRPGVVKRTWRAVFARNAERYLDELVAKGPGADLVWDFAAPYAAENLREIIGLHNASQQDLQRWSQTMIDATGNYADDPEVWAKGRASFDEVDVALDEMLAWHRDHPDHSLLSALLRIPDYRMPVERIRANVKMTIGGGLNEPRDALGVAAWALLGHPAQRAAVEADASLWHAAFDEAIRWVAPIGLYSREVTRDTELAGVHLPAGARLGICVLSANRDETVWPDAAAFDIRREVTPHLAFGKGVHVCLGAWVARAEVAEVGLPMLFERLRGLDLVPDDPAEIGGWVFRGMTRLPVTWTGVTGASAPASAVPAAVPAAADAAPRVAIVGSGPAGCFAAQALRRTFPAAEIDVFDAMPVPYGLVRYGVAADHQGTKSVARQFDRMFQRDGVRFHGNVRIGADLALGELRAAFDAVVLATGLRADARLDIPGGDLPGVVGAGRVTRLLNGHPETAALPELGREVVIVGHGNVAMDVARLLCRDEAELADTDIDDASRAALGASVRRVHLVGRSSPDAARFDPVMVRELAGLAGVRHVVHGLDDLAVPDGKDARIDAVRALAAGDPGDERIVVEWWFGLSPRRIEGAGHVERVVFDAGGEEVALAADGVVTAVGFTADEATPVVPGAHPDGRVEPGLYVAGWLRRGPRGTIPDQRTDALTLARVVVEDVASGAVAVGHGGEVGGAGGGRARAVVPEGAVDFDGWRRIDLRERLSAAPGRSRAKLRTFDEMLRAAADAELVLPESAADATPGEPGGWPVPVTVLFGTESGSAELVADELCRAIGGDTEALDLADVDPEAMDRSRLHVIVCSTYGDGEVPTAARPFHRALVDGRPDLVGLRYAVFGMGDRSYTKTYSRGSELIDEALAACGAERVGEYGRHDAGGPIEAGEAALGWLAGVAAEVEQAPEAHR